MFNYAQIFSLGSYVAFNSQKLQSYKYDSNNLYNFVAGSFSLTGMQIAS